MSLFMQKASDVIIHASSKIKQAIVEIYEISRWTKWIQVFQGLASASVTKRFESVLPFFSNPCLGSSFDFESNFINALIHGR
jgi:hypothetical protein